MDMLEVICQELQENLVKLQDLFERRIDNLEMTLDEKIHLWD
jgi:hypothetical protein